MPTLGVLKNIYLIPCVCERRNTSLTSFCHALYPTTAPMLKDMTNNTTNDTHLFSSNTSNILKRILHWNVSVSYSICSICHNWCVLEVLSVSRKNCFFFASVYNLQHCSCNVKFLSKFITVQIFMWPFLLKFTEILGKIHITVILLQTHITDTNITM